MDFSLVYDAPIPLAETPVWDERTGFLYWTDFLEGSIHRFCPASGIDIQYCTGGGMIGSAIPTADPSVLLCATDSGICLFNTKTGALSVVSDPNEKTPQNRCNEMRVDARGRILVSTFSKQFGSPGYSPDQTGSFFMIDTNGAIRPLVQDIQQYNGIVWTNDTKTMYVVDSYHCVLNAFDYDIASGAVGLPKQVLDFSGMGMPDGMAIDSKDNLYICHWSGIISVWTRDCKPIKTLSLPVQQVCCCGFGGKNLTDLYVTTGCLGYTAEQMQNRKGAGGIFCGHATIPGANRPLYDPAPVPAYFTATRTHLQDERAARKECMAFSKK